MGSRIGKDVLRKVVLLNGKSTVTFLPSLVSRFPVMSNALRLHRYFPPNGCNSNRLPLQDISLRLLSTRSKNHRSRSELEEALIRAERWSKGINTMSTTLFYTDSLLLATKRVDILYDAIIQEVAPEHAGRLELDFVSLLQDCFTAEEYEQALLLTRRAHELGFSAAFTMQSELVDLFSQMTELNHAQPAKTMQSFSTDPSRESLSRADLQEALSRAADEVERIVDTTASESVPEALLLATQSTDILSDAIMQEVSPNDAKRLREVFVSELTVSICQGMLTEAPMLATRLKELSLLDDLPFHESLFQRLAESVDEPDDDGEAIGRKPNPRYSNADLQNTLRSVADEVERIAATSSNESFTDALLLATESTDILAEAIVQRVALEHANRLHKVFLTQIVAAIKQGQHDEAYYLALRAHELSFQLHLPLYESLLEAIAENSEKPGEKLAEILKWFTVAHKVAVLSSTLAYSLASVIERKLWRDLPPLIGYMHNDLTSILSTGGVTKLFYNLRNLLTQIHLEKRSQGSAEDNDCYQVIVLLDAVISEMGIRLLGERNRSDTYDDLFKPMNSLEISVSDRKGSNTLAINLVDRAASKPLNHFSTEKEARDDSQNDGPRSRFFQYDSDRETDRFDLNEFMYTRGADDRFPDIVEQTFASNGERPLQFTEMYAELVWNRDFGPTSQASDSSYVESFSDDDDDEEDDDDDGKDY